MYIWLISYRPTKGIYIYVCVCVCVCVLHSVFGGHLISMANGERPQDMSTLTKDMDFFPKQRQLLSCHIDNRGALTIM